MRIGVLGPLHVVGDGPPLSPRDRVVLATLVVTDGRTVPAEVIADALWPGTDPPASWVKVVQGCIVRIRRTLGPGAIETDGKGYRLVVPPDDIDARSFERSLSRARELLAVGEPDRALYAADEALTVWRGQAFPELDEWEPGRIERTRLGELQLDAEELRLEAALGAGRYREVLADAGAAVARAPLREHRWCLLAMAQHQAGRQGDALRTLHDARRTLLQELGVDPGDGIVALEAAILRQDPTLAAPRFVQPSDLCPFQGLSPYEAADADLFFGRAAEVAACLERLRTAGVLAIVGASGSGKSSLMRAGLTPALERAGHCVALITPGPHPMRALEAATAPDRGATMALLVDQCEEAVTMCADAAERGRFFDALVARAALGPVIIGLRADRLGELADHPSFAAVVERGMYLLRPMATAQLREAIEGPARQAGLLLEAGLIDLLLRDVENEPGSLPLLSHALYQTWLARQGSTLTVAGYQSAGGIRGAVAQSAEHLYERLPPGHRPALRSLVLRLVAPSADGEPVRARVPRRIIAPDPDRQRLLDDLVAARLVTTGSELDGASVELAHEALVRAWPRLREWLDDDAEGQRIWRHLTSQAHAWDAMDRPDSELYRGMRLARAVEWRKQGATEPDQIERDFLAASERLADGERAAGEAEAYRQARANRRLRGMVAVIAVLALLATLGAVATGRQADRADRQAAVARSEELATAAMGAIGNSPALARSLALAAADAAPEDPSLAVVAALHRSLAADPTVARWGFLGEVGYVGGAIDDAGERLAAAGTFQPDGAGWILSVADVASGETAWTVDVTRSGAASVALAEPHFADGGRHVAVGVYWDPSSWRRPPVAHDGADEPPLGLLGAQIRDAATGELLAVIDLGRCGGVISGVSDTHLLVRTLHGGPDVLRDCRWRDGTIGIELVERATGKRTVLTAETGQPWHLGAAMSGDGTVVAFDTIDGSGDGVTGEVVVADVASGAERRRVQTNGVRDLDRTGTRLLAGWHEAQVWDVATGEAVTAVDVARNGRNADSRFMPDGRAVVSTSDDGTVRLWDSDTGAGVGSYPGMGSGPVHVSPSGLVTVTNPDQQVVTVLDTRRRGELGAVDLCGTDIDRAELAVIGSRAFVQARCVGDPAAGTLVVDLDMWRVERQAGQSAAALLAMAPDNSLLVTQRMEPTGDGPLRPGALSVVDAATGAAMIELAALPNLDVMPAASRVRWSPDGRLIAAAMGEAVAVWDAGSGRVVHVAGAGGPGVQAVDVLFTPDSSSLISTADDRTLTRRSFDAWDEPLTRSTFVDGAYRIALVGFADGGRSLVAVGGYQSGGSSLVRFDAATLAAGKAWPRIGEGSVISASMSPDGRLTATASTDGTLRVWDTATGEMVHDMGRSGRPPLAVAFVSGSELLVAAGQGVERVTIDTATLKELVRRSLTHGFTDSECATYRFGPACPTLDQLRARPGDEGAPVGTYRVTWSQEELVAVMRSGIERHFDAPLWDDIAVQRGFQDLAADLAGSYTLQLGEGRFELQRAGAVGPECIGSVRYRPPRLSLMAERGPFCSPAVLFEADTTLADGELRLDADTMRAEVPNIFLFATRPLEQVG